MPVTRQKLRDTKSLLTKKGRRERKQFLAEGIRLLEEAVRFRYWPDEVLYSDSLLSERGRGLLGQFSQRGIPADHVAARDFAGLCDTRTPQGIVGVFRLPNRSQPEPWQDGPRTVLVCDSISDPGNMGTLLRSALAFGFRRVRLFGRCADPYAPRVVRASAGALFGLGVDAMTEKDLRRLLTDEGFALVAADVRGRPASAEIGPSWRGRHVLLAVGSEAEGVSPTLCQASAVRVRLEHDQAVESLNAAVAASILMKTFYDLNRQVDT